MKILMLLVKEALGFFIMALIQWKVQPRKVRSASLTLYPYSVWKVRVQAQFEWKETYAHQKLDNR